jgi:hypothetical protein
MRKFSDWRVDTSENINEKDITAASDAIRSLLGESADYLRKSIGHKFSIPNELPVTENLNSDLEKLEKTILTQLEEAKNMKTTEVLTPVENNIEELGESLNESVDPLLDYYKLYRDREEQFECNISVTGASLATAQVRLIFDTTSINVVFYGKLYKDGKCLVPLQKMTMFPEGTRGQLRLEVVVDDTMFVPWESSCIVEGAKRVTVDVKQKKGVSINFGDSKQE